MHDEEALSMHFLRLIGKTTLNFFENTGYTIIFLSKSIFFTFTRPFYAKETLKQVQYVGYFSLPIVGLTALFTGMVLALQSYIGFARFSAQSAIPNVLVISITGQLGPVLTALMVAGRVGAGIAAELGTMRVTEQIDALSTLSTNPFRYLMVPRFLACIFMMPLLVLISDVLGVLGGYLISIYKLGFLPHLYLQNTWNFLATSDVISGIIKSFVFGLIIALMGCYHGYHSKGGAAGVGKATTNAVVSSSALILIFNYIITELLAHM